MKKILTLFFATMLAVQALASQNYDFYTEGIYFRITSNVEPYTVAVTAPYYDIYGWASYDGAIRPSLNLIIPETVTYNGIQYTVTSISGRSFNGCDLTSVTIPNTIESVGRDVFTSNNLQYKEYGGAKYIGNAENPYLCLFGITSFYTTTYEIHNDCRIIADAFYDCRVVYNKYDNASYLGNTENPYLWLMQGGSPCTINSNCKFINERAFYNNNNIESIIIPESVISIGKSAFEYCSKLKSVNIPNSVTSIGSSAFDGCNILDTLTYNTEAIGSLFRGRTSLRVLNIGDYVTNIADNAFNGCINLTSVTIPNDVTSIGANAFAGCIGLKSLTMGNSVENIGNNAFRGCKELTTIIIPESVISVEEGAFSECDKLDYNVYDNGCYIGNEENPYMILFKAKKQDISSCNINSKCKIIGGGAFNGCYNLESITIPESVISIGCNAFKGCTKLEKAVFASVSNICQMNFGNSFANPLSNAHHLYINGEEVTDLVIPGTNSVIGNYSFYGCNNIKSVSIPNSVAEIGISAFDGCNKLKYLTIPKSISILRDDAFYNCDSLLALTTESDADFSNTALFFNNKDLRYRVIDKTSVEVSGPSSVTSISQYERNYGLKTIYQVTNPQITIPVTVTAGNTFNVVSIGNSAFENIGNLKSITIPEFITTIGELAFADCNNIEMLEFNTDSIETHFAGKSMLKSVHIGEAVTNISTSSFSNCNQLTIVTSAAIVPPTLPDGDPFTKADTIYVKAESVDAYQTAPYWKRKVILPYTTVTIKNDNDSVGTIEGSRFLLGEKCTTLTAIPAEGYHFTKWYDGNTDNPRQFTTSNSAEITASFEKHTVVVDSAVAATCSATGLTEGSHCSVCGMVIKEQISIGMTSHHWVVDSAVAVTCTTTGLSEGSHCDVCGFVRSRQYEYPALGHEFSNYVYNNDATTIADGTETATCWRCGETDTRVAQGTKLATAISEPAANNLQVYAHGNTIIVENATDEIRVYDAMGRLVVETPHCDVSTEIRVNTAGVYIVKVGNVTKRVMVN